MLIWIPSLISVPPTAPSVVCQPRFKMQSRANFPSSQLQIISNFPAISLIFACVSFSSFWISLLFIRICVRFPWFSLLPRQFFLSLVQFRVWSFWLGEPLEKGAWSISWARGAHHWLICLLTSTTTTTNIIIFLFISHMPTYFICILKPTYYIYLPTSTSTTTNIIIFAFNFVKE